MDKKIMSMIFHDDGRIECKLSSIQGVSPRLLNDGYRMLLKKYREMVSQERVIIEKGARQATLDASIAKEKEEKAFNKKEDARLAKAAKTAEARHLKATGMAA